MSSTHNERRNSRIQPPAPIIDSITVGGGGQTKDTGKEKREWLDSIRLNGSCRR